MGQEIEILLKKKTRSILHIQTPTTEKLRWVSEETDSTNYL